MCTTLVCVYVCMSEDDSVAEEEKWTEQGKEWQVGGTGTYRGLSQPPRGPPCTEPPSTRGLQAGIEPVRDASTWVGRQDNRRRPDASALQPRGLLLAPTQASPHHVTPPRNTYTHTYTLMYSHTLTHALTHSHPHSRSVRGSGRALKG